MEALIIILLIVIIWLLLPGRKSTFAVQPTPSEIGKLAVQLQNKARQEGFIVSRFILRPDVIYKMIELTPIQACDAVVQEFQTNLDSVPFNLPSDAADKLREIYIYLLSKACTDGLDKGLARANIDQFVSFFPA